MKVVVNFLKRTDIRLMLYLTLIIVLVVASFADVFVILMDIFNWIKGFWY